MFDTNTHEPLTDYFGLTPAESCFTDLSEDSRLKNYRAKILKVQITTETYSPLTLAVVVEQLTNMIKLQKPNLIVLLRSHFKV